MAVKWIKTAHKGLRYHEHPTRKHGKKRDRYYAVRFRNGKEVHEYGIGWVSDGVPEEVLKNNSHMGFEEYCLSELRQYKGNAKTGTGVKSPKEKRKLLAAQEAQKQAEAEQRDKDAITFDKFFKDTYLPQAKADKKERTATREEGLFTIWISPVVGHLPMKDILPFHLEKLKKTMTDKEQSPRSIEYALSVVRQVFNAAKRLGVYEGENPTSKVKFPKPDNGRMRFLTHEEANKLLEGLKAKSIDAHDMTLLSLHCGLRFGEIASLTWQDVDLKKGVLTIRDAKAGSRYAFLTEQAIEMLTEREQGKPSEYVFPGRNGKMERISPSFFRVIDDLKLNKGITDPRLKICFHSCRHSHASWMIEQGVDLYTVQKLLGHKTNFMTRRYTHLTENRLREAANTLSSALKQKAKQEQKDTGEVMNL